MVGEPYMDGVISKVVSGVFSAPSSWGMVALAVFVTRAWRALVLASLMSGGVFCNGAGGGCIGCIGGGGRRLMGAACCVGGGGWWRRRYIGRNGIDIAVSRSGCLGPLLLQPVFHLLLGEHRVVVVTVVFFFLRFLMVVTLVER